MDSSLDNSQWIHLLIVPFYLFKMDMLFFFLGFFAPFMDLVPYLGFTILIDLLLTHMNMVEVSLLCVVGFSVLAFLYLDKLEKYRELRVHQAEKDQEELIGDWEGVERTELEKIFGQAIVFVNSITSRNAHRVEDDVKLQLYGLQKVALQGPCYGSQPIALKLSARSKWNAWQKVGNMSREMAMEKYVEILSKAIPKWKVDNNYTNQLKQAH